MGLRRKWIDPEQTWLAEEHANTSLGEQERHGANLPCCAKCRRGIKAFGLLPCGYEGRCPNECHTKGGA